MSASDAHNKFLENVQVDLKHLAHEAKKKHPAFRKSCEEAAARVSEGLSRGNVPPIQLSEHVLNALVQGCELKEPKIVKQCLGAIQRLIMQRTVSEAGAGLINAAAWSLMRASVEEVKVLQTVTLLLTTSSVARGETLAKALALCFRLCFCRDSTVMNTAVATVWQIVSLVFERVVAEMAESPPQKLESELHVKPTGCSVPASLKPAAADAYLLFQDLVLLVNGEQPCWLCGLTEMTRTFGLDLMESLLSSFPSVFLEHWEFTFLLKERVCAMAIRLFSPNVKCRSSAPSSPPSSGSPDKPYFPTSLRLMRVISVLIQKYYSVLVMECEIFLSLLVKLLDWDRPHWQRALALEVLHQLCVSKQLIVSFCASYDMRPQSTKVFQEIINALEHFVSNLFSPNNTNLGFGDASVSMPPPSPVSSLAVGLTALPTFSIGEIWIPLSVLLPLGTTKATFMEMKERIEPPAVPEGYGLALAYACLLELVENIHSAVCQPSADSSSTISPSVYMLTSRPTEVDGGGAAGVADNLRAFDLALAEQLVLSSCDGLLSLLSLLLQASSDEGASESLLRCLLLLTQTCGAQRHLVEERDKCVAAICRATLPPHYHLSATQAPPDPDGASASSAVKPSSTDLNQKQQVVAVGAALPTSSLVPAAHQCPVMLTAKNLQCLRTLMSLAVESGAILDKCWYMVLVTLQHVAWVLGLRCNSFYSLSSSSSTSSQSAAATSSTAAAGVQLSSSSTSVPAAVSSSSADVTAAVLTTAVLTDLPALTKQLETVLVASRQLDEVALHHVIDALSRLNAEVMVIPVSNREPSLFAVSGLLGVGLANSDRAATYWRPLTAHLLEACRHQHVRMREASADAVACLVRSALQADALDQKLQTLVLTPLLELNCVGHAEVRLRQLQCTLHVLHSCGERLATGWPLLLDIVAGIDDKHTDQLVRLAFQCLQLIVTDLLTVMPSSCLLACVNTVALFGSQKHELNIALTAIGFMWNISDFFYQNSDRLSESLSADSGSLPQFPNVPAMSPFDRLWMCLFSKIGDLCVDSRPAVRKSAGQTLFSTISAHGSLLVPNTWSSALTQVLFPLLERVTTACNTASMDKLDDTQSILIHHTRNTAHKQWAETQVLALSGVVRVFQTRHSLLSQLTEFQQFWSVLMGFVQRAALSVNSEVSLASLKALQELIDAPDREDTDGEKQSQSALHWHTAWKVWLDIGVGVTSGPIEHTPPAEHTAQTTTTASAVSIPSQLFLTTLVQTFPALFVHVQDKFDSSQFKRLCSLLTDCVSVPVSGDTQYSILADGAVSPLQEAALSALDTVTEYLMTRVGDCDMLCLVFDQLFTFVQFGCRPAPSPLSSQKVPPNSAAVYVTFAEGALSRAISLYERTLTFNAIIEGHVLEKFIQCVEVPLAMKYSCAALSYWRGAVRALVSVLRQGLPLLRQHRQHALGVWSRLPACLDNFLFSKSKPPENYSGDNLLQDESLDCAVVQLIRQDILPYHTVVPNRFLVDVMLLLNKGSLHSDDGLSPASSASPMREQFASACFDTLLVYSLRVPGCTAPSDASTPPASSSADHLSSQLAVTALVHRFHEVLTRFLADSVSSGQCPLPRHRMTEMCFVLRAIKSVLISIRSSEFECVNGVTWQQLVRLYSPLVQCTLLSSGLIAQPLCDCLLEFGSFLHPTAQNSITSDSSSGK